MSAVNKKAFEGLAQFLVAMALLLFLPAWTVAWWQAWVFLAITAVLTTSVTLYLMRYDPKLLERRVSAGPGAEKEKSQKIIQSLASLAFIALIALPALDHRFGWSSVPSSVVIVGDILILIGFLIIFFVFKENTFTSGTIAIHEEQKVISTGLYAWVRHPMYTGGLIFIAGVPLALGSYWGLSMFILLTVVIIWRLLDEEKFLAKNLPGYVAYEGKVKYRLVPFIW
jgi:protein-S-isoprenylcysteine O-methyltransferase Ste14